MKTVALVYNGTSWDMRRSVSVGDAAATGIQASGNYVYNGATWDRLRAPTGDALATGLLASANYIYNGTTLDRWRSASALVNTAGTGLPGVGTLVYDGTNWQAQGGFAGDSGQNAALIAGNRKEVSFSTTTAQAVAFTDVSNYRGVSVQITSQGTGSSVAFQASNDNVNWVAINLNQWNAASSAAVNSTTAANIFYGQCGYRYFRLNVTGISAGTTAGVIEFMSIPPMPYAMGVALSIGSATPSDALAMGNGIPTVGAVELFNGTTYDRARSLGAMSATTNASTGIQAAGMMYFDGTNFRMVRGDTFGNIGISAQSVSGTGDANALSGALAVGNMVFNGTNWDRQRSAVGAGTGVTAVAPQSSTAGGATPFKLISAATTNATSVKGSAGTVYSIVASNANAAVRYLKLYDKATAPTVGTDVPVHTFPLPANTAHVLQVALPTGMAFANGVALAITANAADNDSTAVGAGDVIANLDYK